MKCSKVFLLSIASVCFLTTFLFLSIWDFFLSRVEKYHLFDSHFKPLNVINLTPTYIKRATKEDEYLQVSKQCLFNLMTPKDLSSQIQTINDNNGNRNNNDKGNFTYSQRLAPPFYDGEWVYNPQRKTNIFHYIVRGNSFNMHEKSMLLKWRDLNVSEEVYSTIYNESTCYPSCFEWKINSNICSDYSRVNVKKSKTKEKKNLLGNSMLNEESERKRENTRIRRNFKSTVEEDLIQQRMKVPIFPLPFSTSTLCKSLDALDIRHILFVGDSIQEEMAISFINMIKWRSTKDVFPSPQWTLFNKKRNGYQMTICGMDITNDKKSPMIHTSTEMSDLSSFDPSLQFNLSSEAFKDSKKGITISYVRNDFLYLEKDKIKKPTCPWIYEGKCVPKMLDEIIYCEPWVHLLNETTQSDGSKSIPPVDFLILNSGMHLHNLDTYQTMIKNLFLWLEKNYFKANDPMEMGHSKKQIRKLPKRFIFRTSAPGHTYHSRRQKNAILGPALFPFEYEGIFKTNFTWHLIKDFNDIVFNESRKLNEKLKEQGYFRELQRILKEGVTLLHADILLHNRADGHADDLHYLLPSGFDWINIALYHHILSWWIEEELLDDKIANLRFNEEDSSSYIYT